MRFSLKRFRAAQGSVFVKLNENQTRLAEARGRITAIDAAHREVSAAYGDLQTEAARVHADSDARKAQIEQLLASL